MSLVLSDDGLQAMLDAMLSGVGSFTVHLFKNDFTPHKGMTLSDLTEADFNGYSPGGIGFSSSSLSSHVANAPGDTAVFTKATGGTGNSIYGYYVHGGSGGGHLLWAERDPSAPVDMTIDGSTYSVVPALSFESKFGSP